MSTDDITKREKQKKQRIQNREAQWAFRLQRQRQMQEEMKEKKDLPIRTEPLKRNGINVRSVHEIGLRQNKRPYAWDSENKVDVKEPRLTHFMTERRRQRNNFEDETWTSTTQESVTDKTVSPQEAHQPQATSVSDAVAPHLLYCGLLSFSSIPTLGRFLSTPEYVADEHTSPSAQSELQTLNRSLSPSLSQNGLRAMHYYDFSEQSFEGPKFMIPFNDMSPLLSDAEFGAVSYTESCQYDLLPVEHFINDLYLSINLNAFACGYQNLTGFLPLGEEPYMVPYGPHLNNPIPAQILEQRDPGVLYFFSKMTNETQLKMKKEDTKLAVKAKEVELAQTNLKIKRLETRHLEIKYGNRKGP